MSASVDSLLNDLKQLITYHLNLISGAENEFQQLQNELRSLKGILEDASTKRKRDETFKVWEREIRKVVHDVEDTIDNRIIQMWIEKDMNLAQRKMAQARRISLAKLVKSLREDKVKPLLESSRVVLANFSIVDVLDSSSEETRDISQQMAKENMIIFLHRDGPISSFNATKHNGGKGDYPNDVVPKLTAELDSCRKQNKKQAELLGNMHFKIQEMEAMLAEKEAIIARRESVIADKEAVISERESLIARKDAYIAANNLVTTQKEAIIGDKEAQIVEQTELIGQFMKVELI